MGTTRASQIRTRGIPEDETQSPGRTSLSNRERRTTSSHISDSRSPNIRQWREGASHPRRSLKQLYHLPLFYSFPNTTCAYSASSYERNMPNRTLEHRPRQLYVAEHLKFETMGKYMGV